ncbi:MAG TPA: GAF domain-containing sensor histidine kinase, partial [Nannocystis exedens]|nr:GAF domain-containing sensor histidine kinase [Nannocystis exedens]
MSKINLSAGLEQLFHLSGELACILNEEGVLLAHNQRFASFLAPREGGNFVDGIATSDQASTREVMRRLLSGVRFAHNCTHRTIDNDSIEISWTFIQHEGLICATGRVEQSARSWARQRLHSYSRALTRLHQVWMTGSNDHAEQLHDLLEAGCEIFSMETGIQSDVSGEVYRLEGVKSVLPMSPGDVFALGDTYCAAVIETGGTVGYHDAGKIPYLQNHPCYTGFGLKCYISAPIRVEGGVYGTLNFSSRTPRQEPFWDYEFQLIEMMAVSLGRLIERDQARQRRDQVLAMVSHDLRSPLVAILGTLDMFEEEPDLTPTPRDLEIMQLSAKRMLALTDDVLHFAEIDAAHLQLDIRPCDIEAVVRAVFSELASVARSAEVSLTVHRDPAITTSRADPQRIHQVIVNLAGNAIKFSPKGETIEVHIGPGPEGSTRVEVRDHGPGIAPENQAL